MSRVVLGVAGGIAAYKACELLRRLTEAGHDVTVVPTPNALEFVGATTWAALSGKPVHTSVFDAVTEVPHVRIGQAADLVVVAPATADLLARAASGRADDLLTNVLLTARCPVLLAPAMHTEMWQHAATTANVATLRERGVVVLDPAEGRLTGADSGPGRLPEAAEIFAVAASLLGDPATVAAVRRRDLAGAHVVVSAGGTHEPLDPVRFLGNASSGRQGIALARAAALRGARVTLVVAHVAEALPSAVETVRVSTTTDLADAVGSLARSADVVVMAAAPADFTPARPSATKIKKEGDGGLTLELRQTTDVLAAISSGRVREQVIVGFAAETASSPDDLLALGRAKLARKGCDLLVLNDVSGGAVFGSDRNTVAIIDAGGVVARASDDKGVIAHRIWDAVVAVRGKEAFVSRLFTSESVTEGHPDKVADAVSDAVLDALLTDDPASRVAVETLVTTGTVVVAGEVTTEAYADISGIARERILRIGYDSHLKSFDGKSCGVLVSLGQQSPDIAQGVDASGETREDASDTDPLDLQGAGDQGLMFGYACRDTPTMMPLPIDIAHRLSERLAGARKQGVLPWALPDGKTQVTIEYDGERPVRVDTVVVSTQHTADVDHASIVAGVRAHVIDPVLAGYDISHAGVRTFVNPTGKFVIGGPMGDAGVTGRKIIVDTYGGMARHGGGAFSGKDPSKVDRSAAYAMRWVAKNVVAAGLADRCEVQVAYAIGRAHPVGFYTECFGTERVPLQQINDAVLAVFDLRPAALIRDLDLLRPIYSRVTNYGHFGRELDVMTWERTDRADALAAAVRG